MADLLCSNIAHRYLRAVDCDLDKYWARCNRLAYQTVDWVKSRGERAEVRFIWHREFRDVWKPFSKDRKDLLKPVSTPWLEEISWSFHCVVMYRGKIHDAWLGEPCYVGSYVCKMFPKQWKEIRFSSKPGIWDWGAYTSCLKWSDGPPPNFFAGDLK